MSAELSCAVPAYTEAKIALFAKTLSTTSLIHLLQPTIVKRDRCNHGDRIDGMLHTLRPEAPAHSCFHDTTLALTLTIEQVQSERAFQKQPHIFLNSKSQSGKSKRVGKTRRFYKDVGLGFRTPKTAIEGSYIDKKCPFTGMVSIRGEAPVLRSRLNYPLTLDFRTYPHRPCRFHKNAPYLDYPPRISSLRSQVHAL